MIRASSRADLALFPSTDRYGRAQFPDVAALLGERRLRRWTTARLDLRPRPKNGVYDPLTFFHLLDELLTVVPGSQFSANLLTELLNERREAFLWDSVTVGRILNDLIETFTEKNGSSPIEARRFWDGRVYVVSAAPEHRIALVNLVDDLIQVSNAFREAERTGRILSRLVSPLSRCPSLGGRVSA